MLFLQIITNNLQKEVNCSDHPRNQNAVRKHRENLGYAGQDLPHSNGQQAGGVNHGEETMERKLTLS